MRKKVLFLIGVMLVFSMVGYLVCHAAGSKQITAEKKEVKVVTSFYPIYVMAQNLFSQTEQVEVANLTENQTGCLHDYQLTAKDMKLLSDAEVFLLNGAGMELFLEDIAAEYAELPMIITTTGLMLLEGNGHSHGAVEEDSYENESETAQEETEHAKAEHEDNVHAENGHAWMDIERYRAQVLYTKSELERLFPQYSEALSSAYEEYDEKLRELLEEKEQLEAVTRGKYVVLFHDAFAYLAESLSMEVIGSVALDEETVPSAGEIAELIEEIRYHGEAWILIEEVYASHAEKIVAETGARVIYLNPLVTGDGSKDSYVTGMKENFETLKREINDRLLKETTE